MDSKDLGFLSLLLVIVLLTIPLMFNYLLKLNIGKKIIISVSRMCVQLFLVGIFLKYIFEFNSLWLNLAWLMFMIVISTISVINTSRLKKKIFFVPILLSVAIPVLTILFYFNKFVVRLDNIFEAKYLIAIGGMLLGNLLNGNIIGANNFINNIRKAERKYFADLMLGATKFEALLPNIRESVLASINPTLASIATVGLVSLPGMMTGQILGGASPDAAVKYQLAIMIAIFVTRILSIYFVLIMIIKIGFDDFDILKKECFLEK
ncbi:MAG: ABC transporter permease [Eubacteriales bacterium]